MISPCNGGITLTMHATTLGYDKWYVAAIESGLQWPSRHFVEHDGLALGIAPTPWITQ